MDVRGDRPDWFCDRIELRNMKNGELYIFKHNDWIGPKKATAVDIPCTYRRDVQLESIQQIIPSFLIRKRMLIFHNRSQSIKYMNHFFLCCSSAIEYKISVKTSTVFGAGTDANVFVDLYGDIGDSGGLHLKNSTTFKDPFEGGHVDVFLHKVLDLGDISKCVVWHDNTGIIFILYIDLQYLLNLT